VFTPTVASSERFRTAFAAAADDLAERGPLGALQNLAR
jgi:hypothetical protein